ncbi:MAG: RIP metalloprotease RseP [Burkholderiales bacterium]|nr:RIP metalloprotease RseP [Burkholderiales bacterium]
MTNAFITIVSFLVTVGVLVVVHEFGHYLVARWAGVKILRFSVGFGRPLMVRRRGPDQTEWVLASIPLGGYVKMLDEREGPVPEADKKRAFNNQNVWTRILIVIAGPSANFLLAFLVYWGLFIAGMPGLKPVAGDPPPATAAAYAGLANGDTVTAVGDEPVTTWNDVRWLLLKEAVKRGTTDIEVRTASGATATRRLDMSGLTKDDLDKDFLAKLGLRNFRPRAPALLGRLLPGSAAERSGLAQGDRVVSIGTKPIDTWFEFTAEVSANPGRPLQLEVERAGRRMQLRATPDSVADGDNRIGRLGVEAPAELKREYEKMTTLVRYNPIAAIPKAAHKVWDLSVFSIKMLGRMIVGDISWKNLSGPITIADYAGQSAQAGWITWLGFLALVSVSLGVLNLLPIPLLDGGHLVYYFAEIVQGHAVTERTMEIGQRLGLALLLALTFFAFYNDINRLFTG